MAPVLNWLSADDVPKSVSVVREAARQAGRDPGAIEITARLIINVDPPTPHLAQSLGLGLLISILADSERQAVQLSLLVLLGSVFFSGFALPVAEFAAPVQAASYLLPATSGIRLAQDVMLRGGIEAPWVAGVLAALACALLLACWLLVRRGMRPI